MRATCIKEEKGIVLVICLLMLLLLTIIGIAGISTSTYDVQIAGNVRTSEQAFYVAEAGINEIMGRFREGATDEVNDPPPWRPTWKLFLAMDAEKAGTIGYASGDNFTQAVQNQMDFRVKMTHKLDLANNVVKSAGFPVYVLESHGFTKEGAKRVIEAEMVRCPILDPQAALYSERPLDILGSSSYIQGNDGCGTNNKPGIATTLSNSPTDPIDVSGNPTIQGNPPKQYNTENADLRGMVDYLKTFAKYSYDYNTNQTLTGYSDQWGKPTALDTKTPISYDGPMTIVYFDMHGVNTVKLAGGSHGAGILLVDGNLELNGDFTWYGLIIVVGALDYTGGGQKNVTGGIMTGETATIQIDVGGNAGIIYCSKVGPKLQGLVSPFRLTKWRDVS